ncbi:L-lactate permease [Solirubrobacter ginsenosidimutans]|uniref:L-lactate permease n=1 Tax=Solirubrobacter ginsenosidimutans TaxID=490573 RepID=A0A9X3MY80_9ACTN|nr:L-lactate permease [Solirubrobacter ginsenosidimutans]MDA0164980.1 L-lactate permease [Solirubrobacter ginsenosidimutans]
MYKQVLDPVSHSLGLTAIFAVLPLLTLFVLLGGLRMKAHWASLIALGVAVMVAIVVYSMPIGQTLDAGAEGVAFGFFPIMWIVINALWIFHMTEKTGDFAVLRRAFSSVSNDQRVQVVIIAFCFGALLEALAGFGTPIAICSVMLVGVGFTPIKAVVLALVADTAPVAFGGIAIPITTLASVTGLPKEELSQMIGRQMLPLAILVPFILIYMVDGRRGVRETWPAALVAGGVFGVVQLGTSNFISPELTNIFAALAAAAALVALLHVWAPKVHEGSTVRPATPVRPVIAGAAHTDAALERRLAADEGRPLSTRATLRAFAPYMIIIGVLGVSSLHAVARQFDKATTLFAWPGLHVFNAGGEPLSSEIFKLNWLTAPGNQLFVCGLLTAAVLGVAPRQAVEVFVSTVVKLRWAIVTVCSVLALAYVMNLSGQTITLGMWMAGAGAAFAFLSPIVGWFGTAVTGSDTSANSLFGGLQVSAAHQSHLSATLLAAANSSGGVMGKMISPQNLAIGAAAVGLTGKEGDIFRKVIGWSILLVLIMAVLVWLQSTNVLSWMVP